MKQELIAYNEESFLIVYAGIIKGKNIPFKKIH